MTQSDTEPSESFEVVVDGPLFRKALAYFESWVPQNQLSARSALWLDGRNMVLRIGNVEVRVPATGTWPTVVLTNARFLISEHEGLTEAEEFPLTVEGDRLRLKTRIGSQIGDCEIRRRVEGWPEFVEQLTPFTMLETLLLPQRFSRDAIDYSGLTQEVERCVSDLRGVLWSLNDAVYETATISELDPAQVWEALQFLLERSLGELQQGNE